MTQTTVIDRDQLDHTLQRLRDLNLIREDVDDILGDLAKLLGLDALALDDNNVAALTVDNDTELYLVYRDQLPGLIAAIPMPQSIAADASVLVKLLQSNMSWQLTHGAVFTTLPGLPAPALCRLLVLFERNAGKLNRELAQFVELAGVWRTSLREALSENTAQPATAAAASSDPSLASAIKV
jgi:hypothetical protein